MVLRLVMRLVYVTAADRFDKSDVPVISFKYNERRLGVVVWVVEQVLYVLS